VGEVKQVGVRHLCQIDREANFGCLFTFKKCIFFFKNKNKKKKKNSMEKKGYKLTASPLKWSYKTLAK
jgi:hypothetical protein